MKFPVLLMRDRLGQTSAQIVGWPSNTATFGGTEREALDRLKHYLKWLDRREDGIPDSWPAEMQLTPVRVAIRCQYENEERAFPCQEEFPLRTICIHAKLPSSAYVAFVPLVGSAFYFYDLDHLEDLVRRSVQDTVRNLTPWQVSALFSPSSYRLESVHVPLKRSRKPAIAEPHLPKLRSVADALSEPIMRRESSVAWERDKEIERVVALLKKPRVNLLLVGESGVGKSAILTSAVRQILRTSGPRKKNDGDGQPSDHRHLRYWITNGARLIAGMKYLGQWEERCEQVVSELGEMGGILCVENLLDLVRVGSHDPSASVASFLLPYLQRAELRIVAECSPKELDACRRLLPNLIDVFEIVSVPPFDSRQAIAVLDRQCHVLEQQRNVQIESGVTALIERLFRRFQPYRSQIGATISFLKDLARSKSGTRNSPNQIAITGVLSSFIDKTGLPEGLLRDDQPLVSANVLSDFEFRIIGQPAATQAATDLVLTFKAGLNDPHRPIGVILLCGPTGVGKTETAKALADYFFGHGSHANRMVRLDMSEFSGYDAARKFVERPDGEPSMLIQSIRQQPLSVLLLDEIEKAAPDVFDVLLTVLDEGRLADRYGRITDFRTSIIVMTSNIGADLNRSIGFSENNAPGYERAVRDYFRPEFVNRIDRMITFGPLGETAIREIARRELSAIAERDGLKRREIRLAWTDPLLNIVTQRGFDPSYGARPLQRTIERLIANPLANWLNSQVDLSQCEIVVDWSTEDQSTRFHVL